MGELAKALVAAQAVMPSVPKTSTNPHYKSKFASLDDIIEKTRPVLNEHGLSIHQFPSVSEMGAPTLVTVLSHVSGERLEYAAPLFLQGQDMQKYGAALTYARRYAWAAALGIANDEDDDGNHAAAAEAKTEAKNETFQAPVTNGAKTITEPQQKRLWAIARQHGCTDELVKDTVRRVAGVESTSAIPADRYDAVIADLSAPF